MSQWGENQDAVQRWLIGHQGNFAAIGNARAGNGTVDFFGEKLIASTLPKDASLKILFDNSTHTIRFGGDESIPIRLANGMFVGGGHGFVCRQLTIPGHGLSFGDLGKLYTNPAAHEYVVAEIVDADQIKIIPRPIGAGGLWQYNNSAVGAALTPVGGGAVLSITAESPSQLYPIVQNYMFDARFDDGRKIGRDELMGLGNRVILSERYGIGNFIALTDWLVAHAGTFSSNPNFGDAAIATQLEMAVKWEIGWTGLAEITVSPRFNQQTAIFQMHAAQIQKPATNDASTLLAFVPETTTLDNLDFAAGANVTANVTQHNFVKSVWSDATNPPACMAVLAMDGAVAKHGVISAIDKVHGAGVPATHAANIAAGGYSLMFSATEKTYLIPAFGITVEAGTTIESHAYAGSINPAKFAPADFGYLAPEHGGMVLYLYKVAPATGQWIALDRRLQGKRVALRRATGGAALHSSTVDNAACWLISARSPRWNWSSNKFQALAGLGVLWCTKKMFESFQSECHEPHCSCLGARE